MNENPYRPPADSNEPVETPLQVAAGLFAQAFQLVLPIAIVSFAVLGLGLIWKVVRFLVLGEPF